MVRQPLLILGLICLSLPLASRMTAQADPDTKEAFQSLYSGADRGLANKDVEAVIAIYSPDYLYSDGKGKQHGYPSLRENVERLVVRYKSLNSKTVVESVKKISTGMIVLTHQKIIRIRDDAQTGKQVVVVTNESDRDFWVHTDDGWKLRQEKVLSQHATRNGVTVN